jgi:prepilin-type N-terminal cleavage/methylation domain-containing protein
VRLGFTLVELLIVIFVIGVLAGIMMLSSYSASDSAKAAVLISNMRNAKAAGIVWFSGNLDSNDVDLQNVWNSTNMSTYLGKYVDSRKIYSVVFIYVANVGYLVGEPDVPRDVVDKAIRQSPGIQFLDSNGDDLTLPIVGSSAAVYVKVK